MTRTLSTDADVARQTAIAGRLERAWNCTAHEFPRFSPVDFWFERNDKPGAILSIGELKVRRYEVGAFRTVWLALTKWHALSHLAAGFSVPALFIVAWNDALTYIDIAELPGTETVLAGRTDRVDVPTDIEPLIEVPIAAMRRINA